MSWQPLIDEIRQILDEAAPKKRKKRGPLDAFGVGTNKPPSPFNHGATTSANVGTPPALGPVGPASGAGTPVGH